MNLSTFDIAKIIAYIVGFGALATPDVIGKIIEPFGASHDVTTHVVSVIGAFVVLATLISNTIKNPSPHTGTYNVVSTSPTPAPDTLTTHADASKAATP